MFLFLVILAIVAIAVIAGKVAYDKSKNLSQEGKIIRRDGSFYEDKELFFSDASYEEIKQRLKGVDLSEARVDVQFDYGGNACIFFRSSDAWNAMLNARGQSEGKNVFEFYFSAWRTNRGIPKMISMNVLVTAIEKTFLSVDVETMVETQRMRIKTKTDFI